ncbi:hypothetical protein N0V88_005141 [Collariella sp. IMI 366227]|nr:hypothetical protein N0V88_005141 [Collariella sp. IMI 366227]
MGAQGLMAVGVPPQPLWLLYIKGAILLFSLIVLAVAAWAISIVGGDGGPGGMSIFIAIFSFIVYGGAGALEIWAPQHFYCIGAFIAYILTLIFWLTAWAWSASWASTFSSSYWYGNYGAALGACAGIGALVWILAIVHFVFFTLACVRGGSDANTAAQAELGHVKAEVPGAHPPQQYPVQQQQQPYPAQPQQYPVQGQYQQPYPAQ